MASRKAILSSIAALFVLTVAHLMPAVADINTGLVAHYRFSGNAIDHSSNDNGGVISGALLTEDRFGRSNSAYSFDGVNDFIQVTSSPSLDIQEALTLSAWVYHLSNASPQHIVNKSDLWDGYRLAAWWANPTGNALEIYDEAQSQHNVDDDQSPTTGLWTHVAATWDGTTMSIYRDGALRGTKLFLGKIGLSLSDLFIGAVFPAPWSAQGFFYGYIDEVRVYNRALSAADIQQLVDPVDSDQDGIPDSDDPFPNDAGETTDSDGDGIGNNTDTDDDNDGVPDKQDSFPLDPHESVDTDGDGIGNNTDTDDDNDFMLDAWEEQYGLNPLANDAAEDPDGDGYTNIQEYRFGTDPTDPNSKPDIKPMPWIPLLLLDD